MINEWLEGERSTGGCPTANGYIASTLLSTICLALRERVPIISPST